MKKIVLFIVTIAAIVAFAVPAAFAATTTPQQEKTDAIYQEMLELRKQLIDEYVASGQITAEQGELMKERMAAMHENRGDFQKRNFRRGGGCGGFGVGAGFAGGYGPGACVIDSNVSTSSGL